MTTDEEIRGAADAIVTDLRHAVEDRLRRLAMEPPAAGVLTGVLDGIRALDRAASLTDVLDVLTTAASTTAGRVVVFLLQENSLHVLRSAGFGTASDDLRDRVYPIAAAGIVGLAVDRQQPCHAGDSDGPAATTDIVPRPSGSEAVAIPVRLAGRVVAVVYADDVVEGGRKLAADWREAVELMARYGGRALEGVTAFRASQLQSAIPVSAGSPASPAADGKEDDAHESARRYARLLVSEIRLYNETAVTTGVERGDLLARLGPEIDRARSLYEARVPLRIRSRSDYLGDELLRTLANGDRTRLG